MIHLFEANLLLWLSFESNVDFYSWIMISESKSAAFITKSAASMSSLDVLGMSKFICQWSGVGPILLLILLLSVFFQEIHRFFFPPWIWVLKHCVSSVLPLIDGTVALNALWPLLINMLGDILWLGDEWWGMRSSF